MIDNLKWYHLPMLLLLAPILLVQRVYRAVRRGVAKTKERSDGE